MLIGVDSCVLRNPLSIFEIVDLPDRLYPILGGAFREAVRDISFNGYRIPRGTRILWSTVGASQAESLYPEPKK